MDLTTAALLLLALVVGAVLGALAFAQVAKARTQTGSAQLESARARADAEVAEARREASQARGEATTAQSLVAQARAETSAIRAEMAASAQAVAEARAEAATAQAEAAEVSASLASARAERDAAREQARALGEDREQLLDRFKVMSSEIAERQGKSVDATAQARLEQTEQLMAPVREALERFNSRLTEVEKERVAMTTDLRHQVQSVQLTGERLRAETAALTTALRKPHVRGSWGEMQLKRVVEMAGMVEHCDFTTQHSASVDGQAVRPDLRVELSEGKCVFVDAKVPLASFLEAGESDSDDDRAAHLTQFGRHVRRHVDDLGTKRYWQATGGESPEFVVMFLPNEALAHAALQQQTDLLEYAASRNVIIASPSTLLALLRTVAHAWRQHALAKDAIEVRDVGRELYQRLVTMGSHVDKVGRGLGMAVKAYNESVGSLESRVLSKARRFQDLHITDDELTTPRRVDEPVRQLTQSDLVADAAEAPEWLAERPRALDAALPERDELRRRDPDLMSIAEQHDTGAHPEQGERRRSS